MITHEYEVSFVLENCVILTLAYVEEEDEQRAISQAEDRLAYDGIDITKLDFQEITARKTGEYN